MNNSFKKQIINIIDIKLKNKLPLTHFLAWSILLLFICFYIAIQIKHFPISSDFTINYIIHNDIITNLNLLSNYWLPPDSMLIKFPFNYVLLLLFNFSIKTIHIASFIQLLFLFILMIIFYKKISNKLGVSNLFTFIIIIFYFILSFNTSLLLDLSNPYARNIEFGICFWILYLLQKDISNTYPKHKTFLIILSCIFIMLVVFIILLLFSDPFFLYSFFAPLAAWLFFLFLFDKQNKYLRPFTFLFICIIFSIVLRLIFNYFGFHTYSEESIFISLDKLLDNFGIFINDVIRIYAIDIFNHSISDYSTLRSLLNLFIFFLAILGFVMLFFNKYLLKNKILYFILLLPILNSFLYILSIHPMHEGGSMRYLLFLPFCFPVGLLYTFKLFKKYKKFYIFSLSLIISASIALLIDLFTLISSPDFKADYQRNYKVISDLKKENLKYGYSEYWIGPLDTFLSQNKIKIRQIRCYSGKIYHYKWVSNNNWYNPAIYTGNTFIVVDKSSPHYNKFFGTCPEKKIFTQFGKPSKIIKTYNDVLIYIWPYNIATNFPMKYPFK